MHTLKCWGTREEIKTYFGEHLKQASEKLKIPEEELLDKLEENYGGYSFDGKKRYFIHTR